MIWFLIIIVLTTFVFAFFIDRRHKKINNHPPIPTNPNAKPGDSSNYMMGDNQDTGGFQ